MTKTYIQTLDLVDDKELIYFYVDAHRSDRIWPEVVEGIRQVGITRMDIYRRGTRLVMVFEMPEELDYDEVFDTLSRLPRQQEWEEHVGRCQQCNPGDTSSGKWKTMDKIFSL